jgi:hypothetical protein
LAIWTPTNVVGEHRFRSGLLILVSQIGRFLPAAALRLLLRVTLGGRSQALCLHRVGDTSWLTARELAPVTIAADRLDHLIDLLLASRPSAGSSWLTVTFDDGYDDAAAYVASRAPRYPNVEFIFFVCPEKTDRGVGFRWDAVDAAVRAGRDPGQASDTVESPSDVLLENEREELCGLGRRSQYRLADVDTIRALGRLPNVALGDHTNGHFWPRSLTDEQASLEYSRSSEVFTRLFGPPAHFAFPFGTPDFDIEPRHIRIAGAFGSRLLWSTEGRPYHRAERQHGAVLPRFPVDGTMDHRQIATLIAARAAISRLRRRSSLSR